MDKFDYDLFVIGGGSGGVRAARIAALYGARVGIAEEYRYGGTCVIRGCVPKKLFVYASEYSGAFEDAAGYGWRVDKAQFDWATLCANKDREITRLEGLYRRNLERAGVELFDTRAVLEGPHAIRLVARGASVTAKVILIATGSTPYVDNSVPGIEHTITSNEAFHLSAFPERVIVAGGGYIAVEFAGIFHGLGAEVTLVYRGEEILRGFDDDLRRGVHEAYEKKGIRVICNSVFSKIEKTADGLIGRLSDGSEIAADQILFAIGRRPFTEGLGLEAAGVAVAENGAIPVDAYSRTNVPHIYAVGDVTDRVNLTPVAIREGHAFADTVFGNRPTAVDHSTVASAVFSRPEIGTVGLSEAEARSQYDKVDIYRSRFRPLKDTLSGRDNQAMVKLVVDGESDRVLGCHILGPDAAELVQVLAIALKMGAKKADFDAAIAVHPTLAEELVTMREKVAES